MNVEETTVIDCDEKCKEVKAKKLKAKQLEEEEAREAARKSQQEQIEKFERKQHGRKRKQRTEVSTEETKDNGFLQKYKVWFVSAVLVVLFAVFCVNLLIEWIIPVFWK